MRLKFIPNWSSRGIIPDVVTDQTPAHDVLMYVPAGMNVPQADALRRSDPEEYDRRSMDSMAAPRAGNAGISDAGAPRYLIMATTCASALLIMA